MAPKQVTKYVPGIGEVTTYDEVTTTAPAARPENPNMPMSYVSPGPFGDSVNVVAQEKAMPGAKTTLGRLQPTDVEYAESLGDKGYHADVQEQLEDGDVEYAEELDPQSGAHSPVQEQLEDEHDADCMCPACCEADPVKNVKKKIGAIAGMTGKSRVELLLEEKSKKSKKKEEDKEEEGESAEEEATEGDNEVAKSETVMSVGDYVFLPDVNAHAQIVRLTPVLVKSQSGDSTQSVQVTVMGGGVVRTVDISEVMPIR